jgi:hypothetical protein
MPDGRAHYPQHSHRPAGQENARPRVTANRAKDKTQ